MMEKHVVFLSNGYGEDSFAQLIATAFLEEAKSQGIPVRLGFMPLWEKESSWKTFAHNILNNAISFGNLPPCPTGVYILEMFFSDSADLPLTP